MNPKIIFSGFILITLSIFGVLSFAQVGQGPSSSPPKLPMNIPPPPSFSSIASKTGKFQIVSAEYYSQDEKAYLYKRLVKYDTITGDAWILHSKLSDAGEQRKWIPLITEWENYFRLACRTLLWILKLIVDSLEPHFQTFNLLSQFLVSQGEVTDQQHDSKND